MDTAAPDAVEGTHDRHSVRLGGKDIRVVACEVLENRVWGVSLPSRSIRIRFPLPIAPAGDVPADPLPCDVDPRDLAAVGLDMGVCVRVCSAK